MTLDVGLDRLMARLRRRGAGSPAFERSHLRVTERLKLGDADVCVQKAFALTYRSGTGKAALEWLIYELYATLYTIGSPTELAIAQCVRIELAELIKDIIRRGLSALEAEEQARASAEQRPPQDEVTRKPAAAGDGIER